MKRKTKSDVIKYFFYLKSGTGIYKFPIHLLVFFKTLCLYQVSVLMSVDRSNEQTINDNGITNGQRKNNGIFVFMLLLFIPEDNISPVSSGRHSRNSRRSRDRSPKHKSRSDKGSSKKKKKERSVTPKRYFNLNNLVTC